MGLPEADRNRWQTAVASAGERVSAADGPNVEIARSALCPWPAAFWPAAGGQQPVGSSCGQRLWAHGQVPDGQLATGVFQRVAHVLRGGGRELSHSHMAFVCGRGGTKALVGKARSALTWCKSWYSTQPPRQKSPVHTRVVLVHYWNASWQ